MARHGTARGIGRSLRIYYGDHARIARMDALHAALVPVGGLVFDIGAHVGDRVASFRRLGCRVVAVEPQPAAFRALRLIHGRDRQVTLVPCAVGRREGSTRLRVNTRNPTVSSASAAFVAAAREAPGWRGEIWDRVLDVPLVTLDALVARHGRPDFVKIDVEGVEDEVLAGLGAPLPAFSVEVTTLQRAVARRCLAAAARLAAYEFNLSYRERHLLELPAWVSAAEMAALIEAMPESANSGDIYARLRA